MAPRIRKPRSRQFAELERTIDEIYAHPRDRAEEVLEFTSMYWVLAKEQGYPDANATMAEIAQFYRHRYRHLRRYRPVRRLR